MQRVGAALLGGLLGLAIAVSLGIVGGVVEYARASPDPSTGASAKAVRLAVGISTAMNCAAAASLVAVPVCALVFVRRRKRRG